MSPRNSWEIKLKDYANSHNLEKLADAPLWQLQECERIGDDLKLSYLPNLLIKE